MTRLRAYHKDDVCVVSQLFSSRDLYDRDVFRLCKQAATVSNVYGSSLFVAFSKNIMIAKIFASTISSIILAMERKFTFLYCLYFVAPELVYDILY